MPVEDTYFSDDTRILPDVQNVVVTMNVGTKHLDPCHIMSHVPGEYKPTRFAAMVVRQDPPSATSLWFMNGNFVCVGGRGREWARTALQKNRLLLDSIGYKTDMSKFELHNRVVSGDIGHPIDIDRIHRDDDLRAGLTPEMFPGLIYLFQISPTRYAVVLVFKSGKYIVMGIREDGLEYRVFDELAPILHKYRATSVQSNKKKGSDARSEQRIRALVDSHIAERKLNWATICSRDDVKEVLRIITSEATKDLRCKECVTDVEKYIRGEDPGIKASEAVSRLSAADWKSLNNCVPLEERPKRTKKTAANHPQCFVEVEDHKVYKTIVEAIESTKRITPMQMEVWREEMLYILRQPAIIKSLARKKAPLKTLRTDVLRPSVRISEGICDRKLSIEDVLHPTSRYSRCLSIISRWMNSGGGHFPLLTRAINWKILGKKKNEKEEATQKRIDERAYVAQSIRNCVTATTLGTITEDWCEQIKEKLWKKEKIWNTLAKSQNPTHTFNVEILAPTLQNVVISTRRQLDITPQAIQDMKMKKDEEECRATRWRHIDALLRNDVTIEQIEREARGTTFVESSAPRGVLKRTRSAFLDKEIVPPTAKRVRFSLDDE